ncbi:5-formyltetrahydrofolate cyclo-ligase [Spirosoma luteum]|uniref:5-formyltetrahydrofolate cyclo-ligase n=1 Tax=Spirosoma luteum TaxID=431553 RepID=UPI00036559CE|nr:5-formyltetrahydrofolate cyclo-ligase [Spirosoma luteum]
MTKTALRREFLARRRALAPAEIKRRSQLIAGHFFDYFANEGLTSEPAVVHSFLAIRRQNEVDTWPIITCFWAKFAHIAISVPVMDVGNRQMTHYTLLPETPLVENKLGIPEPVLQEREKTDLQFVKIVLTPLLAFDLQGHRVGYGGGYYDRFLAEDVPHSRKIGLSLFEPVDSISDVEATDVRLDACITPTQVYQFID